MVEGGRQGQWFVSLSFFKNRATIALHLAKRQMQKAPDVSFKLGDREREMRHELIHLTKDSHVVCKIIARDRDVFVKRVNFQSN